MNRQAAATGSAGGFWQRLVSLTRKETRQLLRDRSNLMVGVGLPIILILLFGYGLSMDVKNSQLALVLEDSSPVAHDIIASLELSPYFSVQRSLSQHEALQKMKTREVDSVVILPSDFSRRLAAGDAQILVLVQGADASRATIVRNYVSSALLQWNPMRADRAGEQRAQGMPGINVVERMWFNADNTSTWYLVPGLIVLIMTLVGAFLTALVIAREWERGTLEALFVTPVHPLEILLSKTIPYFVIGMFGLALCLLAARLLFAVPIHGSLPVLLFSSMLYLLVALATGLLISSLIKNQFLASQLAILVSFLPAMMLSGFIFDLRNAPTLIQIIGQLLPATHFMELIKTLFLAGNVWPLIIKKCAILAGYVILLLGLTRLVTRKSLD